MFKERLLSGAVLVVILAVLLYFGGDVLLGALTVISFIGLFEWFRMLNCQKSLVAIISYIGTIAYYFGLKFNLFPDIDIQAQRICLFVVVLILMLMVYVFQFPKYNPVHIFGAYFGFFYVSVFLSYVYRTRMLEHGTWLVWLIFIASWGCDSCAYCVGMLFGKHKMAPLLSPKKSVEGAIGGVVGTMLLSFVYLLIMDKLVGITFSKNWLLVVAMAVSAFAAMIGDLSASAFKRQFEIKDYGKLIPGHGGILDRFDSVIFIAPLIYYFIIFTA